MTELKIVGGSIQMDGAWRKMTIYVDGSHPDLGRVVWSDLSKRFETRIVHEAIKAQRQIEIRE